MVAVTSANEHRIFKLRVVKRTIFQRAAVTESIKIATRFTNQDINIGVVDYLKLAFC